MNKFIRIKGRRVKYFLPTSTKFFEGEELIIKGGNKKTNELLLERLNKEEIILETKYVRYLNNMKIKIF